MIVKGLQAKDAKSILERRALGQVIDVTPYEIEFGDGESLDATKCTQLNADLLELISDLEGGEQQSNLNTRFDAEACAVIHQGLGITGYEAGYAEFWTWLAVGPISEVVEWRHKSSDGPAHFRNYGVGGRWNNLMARLWFRADLVIQHEDQDPYALARRGAIDFWESGIIRPRYSSCRALARALVRLQYPDASQDTARLHLTHPLGIRELYKRLKRLQATISYEFLDDAAATDLLEDVSKDLVHV